MENLKLDLKRLNKALKTLEDSFVVMQEAEKTGNLGFVAAAEDSTIQRFEYSYEMFWKVLKRYLEVMHHLEDIHSSRRVFHASVKTELCTSDEGDVFLDMADDRNETSHTYSVEASRVILSDIPRYYSAMIAVVKRLNEKLEK
jgi:nucleotidyltransferase substrate binding protein (TIGR01987 family)